MEIEPSEMEENIAFESSPVSIAARFLDQPLDPVVDSLRHGVAQMVTEVRNDRDPVGRHRPLSKIIWHQITFDHLLLSSLFHTLSMELL